MDLTSQKILTTVISSIERLEGKIDAMRIELKGDLASLEIKLTDSIDSLARATKENFDGIDTAIFQLQMHMDARE